MDSPLIFFREVTFEDLKPLIELGFGDDPELMSKYQQLPTEFEETVQRNVDNIREMSEHLPLSYYKVLWGEEVIGFTVLEFANSILYSFGINIKFRKKEVVTEWIEKVEQLFKGSFQCVLWDKNERAINFLIRNGMKPFKRDGKNTFLIKY